LNRLRWLSLLIAVSLAVWMTPASAQQEQAQGPVYQVQSGDTLWEIAARFKVSVADLTQVNEIGNANQLAIGQELIIPGLAGINGRLTTTPVAFGENLLSLSRRYGVSPQALGRLNRVVHPQELYAGASLILLEEQAAQPAGGRALLAPGESALELAVRQGVNPWHLIQANQAQGAARLIPGDVLRSPGGASGGPGALPPQIEQAALLPIPLVQGQLALLSLTAGPGMSLAGELTGHSLHFFEQDGAYYSLQGIYALQEPGFYPLVLEGTLADGARFSYVQAVYLADGGYVYDPVLYVDPAVIDPAVTEPENEQVLALVTPATGERRWQGQFSSPVAPEFTDCWPSRFGSRRSFNESAYVYFHTGLDFCGSVGNQIFAPAAGQVVFAGPLAVRGNTTIIDHGWGVYTAYMHQSEILVKAGEPVEAGQVIGLVGNTGRVTGPHLHWEVWAGGVQVDPIAWLEGAYP
jgi:murein DD-endopeptidase MepM/ murein hydrolase activator NlpD